jgi:hypothetical protein
MHQISPQKQATPKELDQLCKIKISDSTAQFLSNQEEILLFLVDESQQLLKLREQQTQSRNMIKTVTNKINELHSENKTLPKKIEELRSMSNKLMSNLFKPPQTPLHIQNQEPTQTNASFSLIYNKTKLQFLQDTNDHQRV